MTSSDQEPPKNQVEALINLFTQGRFQNVLIEASQTQKRFPTSVLLYNVCGGAHMELGQFDLAIENYEKALLIKPNYADAFCNIGIVQQKKGELNAAIQNYKKAIKINSRHVSAHYNMGISYKTKGDPEGAIICFKKAIKLHSGYAEAYNNMGIAFIDVSKLEKAVDCFKQAVEIKPDYAEAHYNMGNALREKNNLVLALSHYQQAFEINPNYVEALNNIGNIFVEKGQLDKAIYNYEKVVKINPQYFEVYFKLANIFLDTCKPERAIDCFKQVIKIKPDHFVAYNNMGTVLLNINKTESAIECFNKAVKNQPDYALAYSNLGLAFSQKGELGAAVNNYNQAIKFNPKNSEFHRGLSLVKKYKESDSQILQMEAIYFDVSTNICNRCSICFALAKAMEDLNKQKDAFYYLREGNKLRKKILSYDIKSDKSLFYTLKKTDMDAPKSAFLSFEKNSDSCPVFILGMPRSGTTLVEQIISSHSKAFGAGELNFVKELGLRLSIGQENLTMTSLLKFRRNYLKKITELADGSPYVTDKMPHNFLYVGLICRTFPDAKIIHLERNPPATCWSNFQSYFPDTSLGYCYDLGDLVEYYKLYKSLMKFWNKAYPGRIYNLNYDKLTVEPSSETKKIISYLNLDWEISCLSPEKNRRNIKTASQHQVRKKIYKASSEKWLSFEPFLKGAFDRLK